MDATNAPEQLEIALNGKRYNITIGALHEDVKAELKAVFVKDIDVLTLLKLYITKAQEYALICQNLEQLYKQLDSDENISNATSVDITAI